MGGGEDGKEDEEEEADTELKTKTPHVNVGNNGNRVPGLDTQISEEYEGKKFLETSCYVLTNSYQQGKLQLNSLLFAVTPGRSRLQILTECEECVYK